MSGAHRRGRSCGFSGECFLESLCRSGELFLRPARPLGKQGERSGGMMIQAWRVLAALIFCAAAVVPWLRPASPRSEAKSYDLLPTEQKTPEIFAEGTISTSDDEAGGVFAPDGSEFYFTKLNPTTTFPKLSILCVSHWKNGKWSAPEVLPFSGRNLDFPARLSPDGQTLFFSSSRPIPGSDAHGLAIWKATKTISGWSEPVALPAPVNTGDGHWNWGPSVTRDGTLYFVSDRTSAGRPQIYRAKQTGD